MREWSPLTIGLVVCAAAAVMSGAAFAYFKLRRRKDPAEIERLRRIFLSRSGRIATGEIIGLVEPEGSSALLLVYRYDVAGVTYEVSQDVAALPQIAGLARHALGVVSSVRYELKHPSNSIIVSEEWCGLPEIKSSVEETRPPSASTP